MTEQTEDQNTSQFTMIEDGKEIIITLESITDADGTTRDVDLVFNPNL
jgi:hypothetical protein